MMTNRRKIFFRADAGPEIGYGHFIRTLALADMLKEDFDCVFYTQTPTDYQKREAAAVCPLVSLPADDSRFDLFLNELTGDEIVVLDNYFYTTDYQRKIKEKGCKLVCIDDMHDKHYVADVVINHAVGLSRADFDLEPYTELCTGLNWSLLRKAFLNEFCRNQNELQDIFICLGGSDSKNITPKAIASALEINENAIIQVVLGDAYPFLEEMCLIYGENSRVKFHKNLSATQIVELMTNCRIGVVPASGLLWETLAAGLPVVYGYYIDNQIDICKRNPKILNSVCVNDFSNISVSELSSLLKDIYYLQISNIRTFPNRVASNYISLFNSNLTSRKATMEDCDTYYRWANDPLVREMAYNKDFISYSNHVAWFKNKIASNDSHLYVYYYEGNLIGQVRYDVANGTAKIDISIDSDFRGRKMGCQMLCKSVFDFQLDCPDVIITSEVLPENKASQCMFEKSGFALVKKTDKTYYYELLK